MKRIQPLDKAAHSILLGDVVVYGVPIQKHSATLQYGKVVGISYNPGKKLNTKTGEWELAELPCYKIQGVVDHYEGAFLSNVDHVLSRYSLLKVGLEQVPDRVKEILKDVIVPAPTPV